MKVVINTCFGGFGLSAEAFQKYLEGARVTDHRISSANIRRDDENLVRIVETMGEAANGRHSRLKVIEIPDGIEWYIEEYDGIEHVAERHRTWS